MSKDEYLITDPPLKALTVFAITTEPYLYSLFGVPHSEYKYNICFYYMQVFF